jgi:ABC-2 type transport system ATP-binding protein
VLALNDVNLTVEKGDFFALLGPNGAGKSTLIGIISSLVRKDAGKVSIFGQDIDQNFAQAKRYLGLVPQEFNFNNFEKIKDILVYQAGYYGIVKSEAEERADYYLERLGLWDKRATPSRFLSGGMKRRLMIARALIHHPSLLVLDEPTAGVDIELRRQMWDFIQEINDQGTTIILTTHYLEEAESLCRNVAIINDGEIVESSDMRSLLSGLQRETFVLDLKGKVDVSNIDSVYQPQTLEDERLEISIENGQSLNPLFAQLSNQNVDVTSMKNKVNRLEELFVGLTNKGGAA